MGPVDGGMFHGRSVVEKFLLNTILALLQLLCIFSFSGEIKELSNDRPSMAMFLGGIPFTYGSSSLKGEASWEEIVYQTDIVRCS